MIRKNILKIIALLVIGLAGFQLFVSHRLGTSGQRLREVEQRVIELGKENRLLRANLAHQASLAQIEEKARKLGLEEADLVFDLTLKPALVQN